MQWREGLRPSPSAPYGFLLTLTECARRPWVTTARRRWKRTIRGLQTSSEATPDDALEGLVDRYNEIAEAIADADGDGDMRRFELPILRLKSALEALSERLSPDLIATSYRLFACLAYQLNDAMHGEVFFRLASNNSRERGDDVGELATLRTWRRLKDMAMSRGMLPPASYEAPDGQYYALDRHAPSTERISELVDRTGYLAGWWKDMVDNGFAYFENASDRIWFLSTMQRHSVDVGDTWGEAICSQKLALELCAQHAGATAFEQLWRLEELARLQGPANQLLAEAHGGMAFRKCESNLTPEQKRRVRQLLHASMWSGSDRTRSPLERCRSWLNPLVRSGKRDVS